MRRIALSLGDPNGIGPEIVLKALAELRGDARLRVTVFGTPAVLERAAAATGLHSLALGTPAGHAKFTPLGWSSTGLGTPSYPHPVAVATGGWSSTTFDEWLAFIQPVAFVIFFIGGYRCRA